MMSYYIGTVAEIPASLKKEAEDYICQHKDVVVLATKQKEEVHLTLMGLLHDISLQLMYMQTTKGSEKVNNIQEHERVEIAITGDTGGIVLTCIAEIVDDELLKKEKWEDWMMRYHAGGYTDPAYVLLKLVPQEIKMILLDC